MVNYPYKREKYYKNSRGLHAVHIFSRFQLQNSDKLYTVLLSHYILSKNNTFSHLGKYNGFQS